VRHYTSTMPDSKSASGLTEFEVIAKYFARPARHAVLGVGDDGAIIAPSAGSQVVASTDMMVEGVHFFEGVHPAALGHKALAVNLSDLAAMGATPRWAMLSLALPAVDPGWLESFALGFFTLAERHDVDLIGGDTTRGPLNICVQIMGEVAPGRALRRDGAHLGDDVWVSGHLGDAAAAVAHRKGDLLLHGPLLEHCLARLDKPTPRVELGLRLAEVASAAIDVSDGLLADLGHLCSSSGVGATIDFDAIPCSAELLPLRHHAPVTRAILAGGDDYELCFTAAPGRRRAVEAISAATHIGATRIGSITEGGQVIARDEHGKPISLEIRGFDHFRR